MNSLDAKQSFLRTQILEKNYDAEEFLRFIEPRLNIADNMSYCSLEELRKVVKEFKALKADEPSQYVPEPQSVVTSSRIIEVENNSIGKPKKVLFSRPNPNFIESEANVVYECVKIQRQFANQDKIICSVGSPERKSTGGFFGIGGTSFLDFPIQTLPMKWKVGRRYSDFVWLRQLLGRIYPSHILPPIPVKKAAKKTQRHLSKRMKILEYFLNDLVQVPELLNTRWVQGFLSIVDPPKFTQLKEKSESCRPNGQISSIQNMDGRVHARLTEENKSYLDEMQTFIPFLESSYKQITRGSKALQDILTEQVNKIYEIGNMFAQVHDETRDLLNKLPNSTGLRAMKGLFVGLNNTMIEWGTLNRNVHQFLQENFNTFFKYIRNELHVYNKIFEDYNAQQLIYANDRAALERKKQKIFTLYDASKWQIPARSLGEISKATVHNKVESMEIMLPKDTIEVNKTRDKLFVLINEHYVHSNEHFLRSSKHYRDNFKEFTIRCKVNQQQLNELWTQMSTIFSEAKMPIMSLKEAPSQIDQGEIINDD